MGKKTAEQGAGTTEESQALFSKIKENQPI